MRNAAATTPLRMVIVGLTMLVIIASRVLSARWSTAGAQPDVESHRAARGGRSVLVGRDSGRVAGRGARIIGWRSSGALCCR